MLVRKNKRKRRRSPALAGGGLKIVLMEKLLPHHHKNRREIFYKWWNIFILLRAVAIFDRKIFIVFRVMVFWGWNNKRLEKIEMRFKARSTVLMRKISRAHIVISRWESSVEKGCKKRAACFRASRWYQMFVI